MKCMLLFFLSSAILTRSAATIEITSTPPVGEYGQIHGIVRGVDPSEYKLALVNDVFDTFWSKPTEEDPAVTLNADGTFRATFITGGQDQCAKSVYFFVVPTNASIPIVLGGERVPQQLYDVSVGTHVLDRLSNVEFTWSGRLWTKKDTVSCVWDPGLNYFSGENVWVDDTDRLHLTIRYTDGRWRCSEIILKEPLGYGTYRFFLGSDTTSLPAPVVLGLFTYDQNSAYNHRELDIEFSNGDVVGASAPWQYVIQPYSWPNQRERFIGPTNTSKSTHAFTWAPGRVSFESYEGLPLFANKLQTDHLLEWSFGVDGRWREMETVSGLLSPTNVVITDHSSGAISQFYRSRLVGTYNAADKNPFKRWSTAGWDTRFGVPPVGNEKVHMNLWLHDRTPPGDTNQVYEIIVSKFEFERLPNFHSLQPRLQLTNEGPVTFGSRKIKVTLSDED